MGWFIMSVLSGTEIKRKIMHMLFGIIVVILLYFRLIGKMHIFFLIIIGIFVSFLSKKYKIPIVYWIMQHIERNSDMKSFPGRGWIFYLIGIFLVLNFFPLDIAMAAIFVLAFADSASHLVGIRFGKIKHPFVSTKFIEGWFAGLIAGFLAALAFVPWHEALAGSFFAMLVEGIEIKLGVDEVDDNILIPVVAAIAIWGVRALF